MIKKKLDKGDIVLVNGRESSVSGFLTDQNEIFEKPSNQAVLSHFKKQIKELTKYCNLLTEAMDTNDSKIIEEAFKTKSPNTKLPKGKSLGFVKPEITVYRIHRGKVLTSSEKYIGNHYEVSTDH